MSYQSTKQQMLLSQASIILLSVVAGFFGRGGWQYWLFVIVYFIVLAVLMQRLAGPGREMRASVQEVEGGKVLFQEKECFKIMPEDAEYQKESAAQMRLVQANLILFIPVLFYFMLAYEPLLTTVPKYFESKHLGYVAAYLLLFEGSFAVSQVGQKYFQMRVGKAGIKPFQLVVPRAFAITSKGVLLQGIVSKTALKFPIEDYEIRISVPRRFVEFVKDTGKSIIKIRLYTREPEKAYNIIIRKNRIAKEKVSKQEKES
uniref:DUF2208 domain-containing protein n=1 Tax=Fervidicoccus fontis TaxID=683846 RepID=A0A7J3ZJS9_9CREN